MTFNLSEQEVSKTKVWEKHHDCSIQPGISGERCGTIGDRFSYTFTPTSLGIIAKVTCGCGKSLCLTDFNDW
jgi:hypothetical protein